MNAIVRLAAFFIFATALAGAQAAPAPPTPAPPPTAFDAFTLKPAPPPSSANRGIRIGTQVDPTRVTITNLTLKDLIMAAYGLKPYQVVGPDWLNDGQRFNFTGVTSAPMERDKILALLQPVLEQQFQLKVHHETKDMPIYALVAADGGSKLKPPGPDGVQRPFTVQG
ncbi:MAG: TIGR03435 family protein, partial [Terriglobales bacterium]